MNFSSQEDYHQFLKSISQLPQGFKIGTTDFAFMPVEAQQSAKMDLCLIIPDQPIHDFAAVFTRNALPGAPVILGRERLKEDALAAIIINNKISNVCAPGGLETAKEITAELAKQLGVPPEQVIPSSTGIIGWTLPAQAMKTALPEALRNLSTDALPAAKAIMTTDRFPKLRRVQLGEGSILGIAKGAGMIEPDLATMLAFVLTDLAIPKDRLQELLNQAVQTTLNAISVDADQSTSDSVFAMSSAQVSVDEKDFFNALVELLEQLAIDIVRNGEGVKHVIKVSVKNAVSTEVAKGLAKSVVNSPLVKTAIAGNDPNIGRIAMAIGKYGDTDTSKLEIKIGKHLVFQNQELLVNQDLESELSTYIRMAEQGTHPYPEHDRLIEIDINLSLGEKSFTVWGGDLTHEYVSENADYRS